MIFKDLQELLDDLLHDSSWDHQQHDADQWCEMHQTHHPDGSDHDIMDQHELQQYGDPHFEQPSTLDLREEEMLLQAMDRSTDDIDSASHMETAAWLSDHAATPEQLAGVNANLKGIYGEMRVLDILNAQNDGIHYELAGATNNPGVDIYGYDSQGNVVKEIQVKMSDSESYIRESTEKLGPQVEVIVPDEMGHIEGTRTIGVRLSDIENDTDEFLKSLIAPRRETLPVGFREFAQHRIRYG
jgi:hypothetical protein